ncbi:hypothetical protein AVEN_247371-1 [Araneus ventricosus]|uniref:Uncharacterized protein n=1 Tax=Araneus ventricosus TaxID=182803 RepID=A0A4Y2UUX9_ARAVE|nr:hypothetical protein AVEN_247371-1 [Araneus ventricosus]
MDAKQMLTDLKKEIKIFPCDLGYNPRLTDALKNHQESSTDYHYNERKNGFTSKKGRGGLVVRSRFWGRSVPGSIPDSTEYPSYLGPAAHYILRKGPNILPLLWCGSLEGCRSASSCDVLGIYPQFKITRSILK